MKNPEHQIKTDGLDTLESKILDIAMHPTHTEIEVDIGAPESHRVKAMTLTIRYLQVEYHVIN